MVPKLQPRPSRNHQAFLQLQILGYPPQCIRKALHKLTGISQPDLAKRLNMPRISVTRYMSGQRKAVDSMTRIASVFDIPTDVMFADVLDRDTP